MFGWFKLNNTSYDGTDHRYKSYRESLGLASFSGMQDHAKWLLEKDWVKILENNGFSHIEIAQRRDERNGKRILLYAHKEPSDHVTAEGR